MNSFRLAYAPMLLVFLTAAWLSEAPSVFAEDSVSHWKNSLDMDFVLIPAGTFAMGSPPNEQHRDPDEAVHEVTLSKPFFMQTTEVTLAQWWKVMGKKFFGRRKGDPDQPVVRVSWFDCQEFIQKMNERGEGTYRLPTEAEWEYACRAGTTTAYSWGNKAECSMAMYGNNPYKSEECIEHTRSMGLRPGGPAPVKSYPANPWGLYDMHGNVWEWCRDRYGSYPSRHLTDPEGADTGDRRVRRGGSWYKYGWYCRSANRNMGHSATRYDTLGFRLVRESE